jgi:hypothetical protein
MLRQSSVHQRRLVPVAQGRQQHDRIGLQAPGDEREHLRGWTVKPLGIFEQDQQRRVGRTLAEQIKDGHRDLESFGWRLLAQPEGRVKRRAQRCGQFRRAKTERAKQLVKAGERQMRLGLNPGRAQHRAAAFAGGRGRCGQQPGLADSRFAGQHQRRAAGLDPVKQRSQQFDLGIPTYFINDADAFGLGVSWRQLPDAKRFVAGCDIAAQVRREVHPAAIERRGAADESDALDGQVAEVDRVAAAGTAHRDGHVLRPLGRRRGVPLAEHAQPPDVVTPPVTPRRPVMRAHREVDRPARICELGGDLHARGPGPDYQYVARGQLAGIAVGGGVELRYRGVAGNERRNDGRLKGAGCRDHEAGVDGAV